jgi:hypothetical protein
MQDVAAFATTVASISDMMFRLDFMPASTGGKPEGDAEIGGALFGDILGLNGRWGGLENGQVPRSARRTEAS